MSGGFIWFILHAHLYASAPEGWGPALLLHVLKSQFETTVEFCMLWKCAYMYLYVNFYLQFYVNLNYFPNLD